eukprot:scaffold93029_cov53-Attheya_sp.AAC.5
MGTSVTIKDPKAVKKSMISGHFNPPGVEHRTEFTIIGSVLPTRIPRRSIQVPPRRANHISLMQSPTTVRPRKRDHEGNPIGTSHPNPVLDTQVYKVEFEDGTQQEYAASLIATSIFAQVDDEGYEHILMDEIIEHKADRHAVQRDDMYISGKNGNKHMRRTTIGWKLPVKWKDSSSDWLPLSDLKESYPVQTAEYAVANKIENKPAFAWWVKETIKRRDWIISQAKTRYQKHTHKFRIDVPKHVADALAMEKCNGNTLWEDSIKLEMKNVMPAFKFLEGDMPAPVAH